MEELWKIWSGLDELTKMKARTYAQFELGELSINYGSLKVNTAARRIIEMVPENIDQLFDACGRKLTNGLHLDFDQKYHDAPEFDGDPLAARLALYLVMRREETLPHLEKMAGDKVSAWLKEFKLQINALNEANLKKYDLIRVQSRVPEADVLRLPKTLEGSKSDGDSNWKRHLYCEDDGAFWAKFNGWETAVLEQELDDKQVLFWLRNQPRKPWAFCYPYMLDGDYKPCYPDFLFVRQTPQGLVCDILDPHDPTKLDAVGKAVGLAQFAEKHGHNSAFGRIEIIAEIGGQLKRIDLMDDDKRAQAKKLDSTNALLQLYELA